LVPWKLCIAIRDLTSKETPIYKIAPYAQKKLTGHIVKKGFLFSILANFSTSADSTVEWLRRS